MKRLFFIALCLLSAVVVAAEGKENNEHRGDGPYVFHVPKGIRCLRADRNGTLSESVYPLEHDVALPVLSSDGEYLFDVRLHDVRRPAWKDPQPEKLFILSDPHGNWEYFVSLLTAGQVIDSTYRWVFGKNHLVIIGDIFDRGDDVLPLFWLVYKLEQEAADAGGKVTFLLGNHEEMVLRNNVRYANKKYHEMAEKLNVPYADLWGADSELGRWLQSRNTAQIIGNNLFVHAGLSPGVLSGQLTIPAINDTVSHYLLQSTEERGQSESASFLFGSNGPLWFRGMVRSDLKYNPIGAEVLNRALQQYGVTRIYVGHTIFKDIQGFFNDRLIGVNVDNKDNFKEGRARGLLIENGDGYVVYDSGEKIQRFSRY